MRLHRGRYLQLMAETKNCRMCGRAYELSRHHLIPLRKLSERHTHLGKNHPCNIVTLCRRCHDHVEYRIANGGDIHRMRLRAALRPEEIEYAVALAGREWFDWWYPLADWSERKRGYPPEPRMKGRHAKKSLGIHVDQKALDRLVRPGFGRSLN